MTTQYTKKHQMEAAVARIQDHTVREEKIAQYQRYGEKFVAALHLISRPQDLSTPHLSVACQRLFGIIDRSGFQTEVVLPIWDGRIASDLRKAKTFEECFELWSLARTTTRLRRSAIKKALRLANYKQIMELCNRGAGRQQMRRAALKKALALADNGERLWEVACKAKQSGIKCTWKVAIKRLARLL